MEISTSSRPCGLIITRRETLKCRGGSRWRRKIRSGSADSAEGRGAGPRINQARDATGVLCHRLRFDYEERKNWKQRRQPTNERRWAQFPEDLPWRVFALLSLRQIFQVRAVCKSWNSVLHSLEFGSFWFSKHTRGNWPVNGWSGQELIAFDASSSTWFSLSSFLESRCSQADLGGRSALWSQIVHRKGMRFPAYPGSMSLAMPQASCALFAAPFSTGEGILLAKLHCKAILPAGTQSTHWFMHSLAAEPQI
ncbi:hypothetical protein L7F22_042316 [Adiantum nelumboides]|nr:hypothetical protein [Adiantum nelumboides]